MYGDDFVSLLSPHTSSRQHARSRTSRRPFRKRSNKTHHVRQKQEITPETSFNQFTKSAREKDTNASRYCFREAREMLLQRILNKHSTVTPPYTMIDVGCGKGGMYDVCFNQKKKFNSKRVEGFSVSRLIQIEPSSHSVKTARSRSEVWLKEHEDMKDKISIHTILGTGHDCWADGSAGTTPKDKEDCKTYLGGSVKADFITLFMSVQFMMSNESVFKSLLTNLDSCLDKHGIIVFMFMDGQTVHDRVKDTGFFKTKKKGKTIFEIRAKYDTKKDSPSSFGDKIEVFFAGVTGLSKGIEEYLCPLSTLDGGMKTIGLERIQFCRMKQTIRGPRVSARLRNLRKKLSPEDDDLLDLYSFVAYQRT